MSRESVLADSRRQFLASLATLAGAGALAGCSTEDVANQEFEATSVGLPEEARRELAMAETFADSRTISRDGGAVGVEGEVTITNYVTAYGRDLAALDETSEHRPTLVDSFVERVNGRGDSPDPHGPYRAAGITAAADLGVVEVTLDVFEEAPTISGDAVSLLVPEGVRGGDGERATPFDDILCFAPISGPFIDADEVSVLPPGFLTSPQAILPPAFWEDGVMSTAASAESTDGRSLLARWGVPDPDSFVPDPDSFVEDGRVLVVPGEGGLEEVFGTTAEEMPGERVPAGETVLARSTGNNPFLLAVPGSAVFHPDDYSFTVQEMFSATRPAPMGGVSYGIAVISTPNESLGGQSVSPLAGMDLKELLTNEEVFGNYVGPGYADKLETDEVNWIAGPKPLVDGGNETWIGGQSPFTLVESETELQTFAGLVEGGDGPWFTVIHMARVAGDDVVIAAGTHSTPVSREPFGIDTFDGETVFGTMEEIPPDLWDQIARGGGFTTVTGERLSPGVPDY